MIQKTDVTAIERVESLLALIKEEGDSIFKIIDIVQKHSKFFKSKLAGSCLFFAANKLQYLVEKESVKPSEIKPICDFTRKELFESIWEMYNEHLVYEGVKRLPDFETAIKYIEKFGLPD